MAYRFDESLRVAKLAFNGERQRGNQGVHVSNLDRSGKGQKAIDIDMRFKMLRKPVERRFHAGLEGEVRTRGISQKGPAESVGGKQAM
ncbi:hypothetical protein D9M69_719090 [compost metagenome]